jgi:hypothetical protein
MGANVDYLHEILALFFGAVEHKYASVSLAEYAIKLSMHSAANS